MQLGSLCNSKFNARKHVTPEDLVEHNFGGTEAMSCIHNFISLEIPATQVGSQTLRKRAAQFGLVKTRSGRNRSSIDRAGFGLKKKCLKKLTENNPGLVPTNNVLFLFTR